MIIFPRSWRLRRRWRWSGRFVGTAILLLLFGLGIERVLDQIYPYPLDLLDRKDDSTRIFASSGEVLRVTSNSKGQRRLSVSLDQVSPCFIEALIAAEDERFHRHQGADWIALARACVSNLSSGRVVSGASTLTMQLAKIVEPRPRTYGSKIIEIFRARQLERHFDKFEILESYLNLAPFGGTLCGVEAASRYWFGKSAQALAPDEAATLVALLPAPSLRSPRSNPALLLFKRDAVLDRMQTCGFLTVDELIHFRSLPLATKPQPWPFFAPHAVDYQLRVHSTEDIHTSLDATLQRRVVETIAETVDDDIDGLAVVALRRSTGKPAVWVGSKDWRQVALDATRCRRAVGSTFKPMIYACADADGICGLDDIIDDTPVVFDGWTPRNFDETFWGPMRASEALRTSRNVPAVRLLAKIGVARFRDLMRELGVATNRGRWDLDAALGSFSASPFEVARAFQLFADERSEFAYSGLSNQVRTGVLRVLAQGPSLVGDSLVSRAAWKTGTSSDRRDAWCTAVSAEYVVVVWRGHLDGRSDSRLVGLDLAAPLCGRVLACLEGI